MDVMLDIETLSQHPDSVILTIGAVKFDPYTEGSLGDALYIRPDVDEQLERGRTYSEDTIEWWGTQPDDVREEALGTEGRISVEETQRQLNKFLVGANNIWTQGPVFDICIIENLYRQYGWPIPWNFWQISDSRTLFKVHGDPRDKNRASLHNALEDCVSQAEAVQKIYYRLELEPRFGRKK